MVNRCLIVVRPKQRYLDWAASLGADGMVPSTENGNAYLIAPLEVGGRDEARKLLERYWRTIADQEFSAWHLDAADWLTLNNLDDFELCFDWDYVDLITDIVADVVGVPDGATYEFRFRRIDGPPCSSVVQTDSKAKYPIHPVTASCLEQAVAMFSEEEQTDPDSDIGPVVDRDGFRWVMVDSEMV